MRMACRGSAVSRQSASRRLRTAVWFNASVDCLLQCEMPRLHRINIKWRFPNGRSRDPYCRIFHFKKKIDESGVQTICL